MNNYNIGEKYTFSPKGAETPIVVEVVAHEFSDRHIWFKYVEESDNYPIVNNSRGNNDEFILPPRMADMVMTKVD